MLKVVHHFIATPSIFIVSKSIIFNKEYIYGDVVTSIKRKKNYVFF